MQASRYHKVLRVSAVVVTLLLLLDGGFFSPVTKQLSDNTLSYVASTVTGVFAGVEPNELNTITAELTRREKELDAREASINERTITSRTFGDSTALQTDYSTYILSVILFILTLLIIINYALDWSRARRSMYERETV